MIATPFLVRLVETGRIVLSGGDCSTLAEPLEAATRFVLACCATLNGMSPGISRDSDGESRIAAVGELMEAQLEALSDFRTALAESDLGLVRRGIDKLLALQSPLMEALGALAEHEKATPQMSPLPAIDQVLKIGLNVHAGRVPSSALSIRLPLLAETMQNLRAEGARCRALHAVPPAVAADFDRQIIEMAAGLGALVHWLQRQDQAEVLLDALRLLRTSSLELMQLLASFDSAARADIGSHKLLLAAELEHAMRGLAEGRVTAAQVREAGISLHAIGRYLSGQHEAMRGHPLLFSVADEWARAGAAVDQLSQIALPWFTLLADDARAVSVASFAPVARAFESATAAVAELQRHLTQHARALEGAPQIEQIVDLLGRLVAGGVTRDYALERVEAFRALQEDLLAQVAPGTGLHLTISSQAAAVDTMARFLDDPQLSWLQQGFSQLQQMHSHVMETQTLMLEALKAAAESQPEYTDIVGGEEPVMLPANLRRLQDIYEQYCAGESVMTVHEELCVLQNRLLGVAADYEQRLGQRAERGSDALLARQSALFRSGLTHLVEAIEVMKQGVALGNLDIIERGLNAGMNAGLAMQQAHGELMANLPAR